MVGAALGFGPDLADRSKAIVDAGANLFVVDSGHGHSKGIIDVVKFLDANYDLPIMAGNIATKEGAQDLIAAGAKILRVGMGPGSICTTRVVTGMGVPQLTAVNEVRNTYRTRMRTVTACGNECRAAKRNTPHGKFVRCLEL